MLTRREVEGQLRNLHPLQQRARRVRRTRWRTRRRMRVVVGVSLAIGLVSAIGITRLRAAAVPRVATLQDSEWGEAYVSDYHAQARPPLFPTRKRSPWSSWGARTHAARDPVTGERRRPKLARD